MQILKELTYKDDVALAIGFFDGVHIAHRKVISSCIEYSKNNNIKSAVLTFSEHPCVSIWNVVPKYIISKQKRIELIEELGTDYLYMIDFDKHVCDLSPKEFLDKLTQSISPKAIFTGYNFFFGKNKSGNTKTLKDCSQNYDYEYFEIPEQKINDISISSTNIRNYLSEGDIHTVNLLLGYDYGFCGTVMKGNGIGRTINFPTANFKFPEELIPLKYGVYSANVLYNGKIYDAVMNFGTKPTIDASSELSAEIHILNFNKDIYSEKITIFPKKYIRGQKKFDSLNSLKNQISNDILKIKNE